jgi:hypothetical protein
VDKALLGELSVTTNGHYAQVHQASELQRVFLKLFEQTAQADTVPLIGKAFSIDAAVSEGTLVVFRANAESQRPKSYRRRAKTSARRLPRKTSGGVRTKAMTLSR